MFALNEAWQGSLQNQPFRDGFNHSDVFHGTVHSSDHDLMLVHSLGSSLIVFVEGSREVQRARLARCNRLGQLDDDKAPPGDTPVSQPVGPHPYSELP